MEEGDGDSYDGCGDAVLLLRAGLGVWGVSDQIIWGQKLDHLISEK